MICEHVKGCGCGQDKSETTGMWYRAESIIEITYTVRIAFTHVLALHHKSNFAFVEIAILPLDFVVKPSAEYLILW
jgi:hypothetical protein